MSNVYTVGQVNRYVKNMFTSDYFLRRIEVGGEVSNCKYHTSGHIYFSLKDETGTLACVMFASRRKEGLGFRMQDGDQVIVTGCIDVYERDGRYQLYAAAVRKDGQGALFERFLKLKQELEDMGMFDSSYKKPLPRLIRRLGVVTAPTGAAIQDIRNVALRRNPYMQIILCPALVQGREAAPSIVRALRQLDELGLDAIILGRGGGSLEDLWAFNEEMVARAVFECETPVISAVGHQTDFTITDFVADLRAPTPSAAAELAAVDMSSLQKNLEASKKRLSQAMKNKLLVSRSRLERHKIRILHAGPEAALREKRQRLEDLSEHMEKVMSRRISDQRQSLERMSTLLTHAMRAALRERRASLSVLAEKMEGLSPLRKLQQGFSYISDHNGQAVYQVSQVHAGQELTVYVSDGSFKVTVRE